MNVSKFQREREIERLRKQRVNAQDAKSRAFLARLAAIQHYGYTITQLGRALAEEAAFLEQEAE